MNARLPEGVLARADFPLPRLVHIHRLEPAFDRLPLTEAQTRRCALFRHDGRFIGVLEDPLATDLQRWVEGRAGDGVDWYLVTPADLSDWLTQHAGAASALDSVLASAKVSVGRTARMDEASADPVAHLVNSTLQDALKLGASDIHLEPTATGLVIRLRIDGVLETIGEVGGCELAEQVAAGLKTLADLDIAVRREPQEGRLAVSLDGQPVDLRLSITPGIHGEDAVLRILDKRRLFADGAILGLEQLGFASGDLARLRALARQPHGLMLVAGPAGGGKTTTLYGMLAEINDGSDKIVTLEDPVEYAVPGVLQIPVDDGQGPGFARGLRAILRHDPDKIMVGEIRDAETAEIAVETALTGRLVLASVNANNAFDVFSRFARFGIAPGLLAAALNGIWAQDLLRTICPHCAEPIIPTTRELAALGLPPEAAMDGFQRGSGCGACRTIGYRGRRAVAEILALDDRLRTLIAQQAPLADIKAEARRQGTRSLRDGALQLARAGLTTLEEVARVTRQE